MALRRALSSDAVCNFLSSAARHFNFGARRHRVYFYRSLGRARFTESFAVIFQAAPQNQNLASFRFGHLFCHTCRFAFRGKFCRKDNFRFNRRGLYHIGAFYQPAIVPKLSKLRRIAMQFIALKYRLFCVSSRSSKNYDFRFQNIVIIVSL